MTAAEARKKQWESLKDKPLTDKLRYIFTYYWPGIVGGLCVLIFIGSWIGNILTQKEIVLSGHIFNSLVEEDYQGDIRQDFMQQLQLDTNKQDFLVTSGTFSISEAPHEMMATMESIVVRIAAGEIDFLVADQPAFEKFTAYHADLRTVLTEDQLAQWADYLVYVEAEALELLTGDNFDNYEIPEYFLSAEGLKDPLPIGIRLPENCRLRQVYNFPKGEVFFGITLSAKNIQNALTFLEYAMDMNNTPTAS